MRGANGRRLFPVGFRIGTGPWEDAKMLMLRLTAVLLAGVGLAIPAAAPTFAQDVAMICV